MKKLIIAAILAVSSIGAANAAEVGVTTGYDFAGKDSTFVGVSIGEKYGSFGLAAGYERNLRDNIESNRFSAVGSYDLVTVKNFPVIPKVGVAYVDPDNAADGFALLVGVGTRYAVTDKFSLTLDYRYQVGENDVDYWDGSQVLLGVNYKF